jgi:ubiquinone/menaquinone biosynthesis C-methylase UbiE
MKLPNKISEDEVVNPLFDLQKAIYTSSNFTRRRLHQTRLQWVSSAIKKTRKNINGPCINVVEYGPGSGIYLPILASSYTKVIAADIECAYLNGIKPLLKKIDNLELVVDDMLNSQFKDNSFDLALCSEVLEHVPEPEMALSTLYRILRPGGVAIVTTPEKYSLMELACKVAFLPGIIQLVRLVYREPVLETGHISLRTYKQFTEALNNCGFEVLECNKFGLYLPIFAEMGGGRFIQFIEGYLHNTVFDWMLWTQAYILRKPGI